MAKNMGIAQILAGPRKRPLCSYSTWVSTNQDDIITANCSFKIGKLCIQNEESGGNAKNLLDTCKGILNYGFKQGSVVWVKDHSSYDFNNQEVERDFLWCKFAEKLEDAYTDDKGATHFYLKEDNPDVLWLLDEIDAFECNLLEGYKSLGDIHRNFLNSVDVVPGKPTENVDTYDKGKPYSIPVPLLGSYNPKKKIVELYIETIEKTACEKNYDFVNLFASTYVHEMMHAYFDRDNVQPNGYIQKIEEPIAEAAMIRLISAYANFLNSNSCKPCVDANLIKTFVDAKQKAKETMHYGFGADLETACGNAVFSYKSANGKPYKTVVEEFYKVNRYSEIKTDKLINIFKTIL